MNKKKDKERMLEEKMNYQNCIMKIIEYDNYNNIVVEFQDKYNTKVNSSYKHFKNGDIKNPYFPSIYGVGIVGNKYCNWDGEKPTKEYDSWKQMIRRCFDKKTKTKYPTYKDVTCCEEWLLYENFYEWLHSQKNFNKWLHGERWNIDKDILIKGNKIYSPETCCLVPCNVNSLFIKSNCQRGILPIGVTKSLRGNGYYAKCMNQIIGGRKNLGYYHTAEDAFEAYKMYKEKIIKEIAKEEYTKGNITKECYDAMIDYEVEIND